MLLCARAAVNLDGKRVAIIGNGASGVQCVEGLYKRVSKLYMFQRTPKWMLRRPLERLPAWIMWIVLYVPFALRLVRYVVRGSLKHGTHELGKSPPPYPHA